MGIPLKDFHKKDEGFRYNGAIIQIVDWDNKSLVKQIGYKSPKENLDNGLSMMFKGAYLAEDKVFVVTNTEVLQYDLPKWDIAQVHTHTSFNDLHAVFIDNGYIYVCNTGMEIVQRLRISDGGIDREWNMACAPTWERFDMGTDYRRIATTKPHNAHINHLFKLNGELWVNLGNQRKARSLESEGDIIDLDSLYDDNEKVLCHDGVVRGDWIYFTSVNGSIIVVDKTTLKVEERIDLNSINTLDKTIGWTRGIEIIENKAYVGISKMRHSKYKEYTKWIIYGDKGSLLSSIVEVDLCARRINYIYEIEGFNRAGIYSIIGID